MALIDLYCSFMPPLLRIGSQSCIKYYTQVNLKRKRVPSATMRSYPKRLAKKNE